jgi:hypothetical protein
MAQAPAFEIEEQSGQRRRVALRGRALPNQGVSFGVRTRTQRTWYAGNPVATQNVLGVEYENTTIEGRWSDRYLTDQVEVRGFDPVVLAEDLVRIFEELCRSGQLVRVQWGSQVRFGVVASFDPTWIRQEDVNFSVEFEWSGADPLAFAPRAGAVPAEDLPLRSAAAAVDDRIPFDPPGLIPDVRALLLDRINRIRVGVGQVFDGLRAAQGVALLPLTVVGSVLTAAESIRVETEDLLGDTMDRVYTGFVLSDRVQDVFKAENWRRDLGFRASGQRTAALRQGKALVRSARPGALAIVKLPEAMTLRGVALRYYGDADGWQAIADVNGFDRSLLEAGTLVVIPPREGRPAVQTR